MNADQVIRMLMRLFMRRGINAGINHGSRYLAGRGKPEEDMTPEERANAQNIRKQANSARRILNMGRRLR